MRQIRNVAFFCMVALTFLGAETYANDDSAAECVIYGYRCWELSLGEECMLLAAMSTDDYCQLGAATLAECAGVTKRASGVPAYPSGTGCELEYDEYCANEYRVVTEHTWFCVSEDRE